MPKTKLCEKYCKKGPPIDWLRAAILERQAVLGYDLKRMSVVGGVSYDRMRHLNRVSPWEWPSEVREKVCKELGVKPLRGVEGMPLE